MRRNWILSILMSIVLLGGVVLPVEGYASAADNITDVTSDEPVAEDNSTDEEQELTVDDQDFLDYLDALEAPGVYEKKALKVLGETTYITSSNRKSFFLKLNNTAIPNYTKYVSMLKQIKPANAELKKIHDKLIKGSYNQLEASILFKKAVSKTQINKALLKQGNEKVAAGLKLILAYQAEINTYGEKLGFEM